MTFPLYIPLGGFRVHPHLFFELIAYGVAFRLLLWHNLRQDSLPVDQRTTLMVAGLMGAWLGAKLLVVAQHWSEVAGDPQTLALLFLGGKTIVGAILGGILAVERTKVWLQIRTATGDVFALPLVWAIAIGRWGCFFTGLSDRTYGIATSLPWGVDFGDGIPRHPTQLYESLFLLLWGLFLLYRQRFFHQPGEIFRLAIVAYLGLRLVIDFLKPDPPLVWGLTAIQWACAIAVAWYLYRSPQWWTPQWWRSPNPPRPSLRYRRTGTGAEKGEGK